MRNPHYTARRRWLAASLALPAGLAASPSVATAAIEGAPCRLGAFWQITHADGSFAQARIDQTGTHFSGSVTTPASTVTGTLHDGRIDGRNLSFRVRWSNGRTSAYRGYIRADGHVEGSHAPGAPNARQLWVLTQRVKC